MNPTRALARPFDDGLSFLVALRLVMLMLVALLTASLLVLSQVHVPKPDPGPRALPVTLIPSQEPQQRHYRHWFDDFPSETETLAPEAAPSFDVRLPHEVLKPRPICR
jgi:hypothetical protein